MLILDTNPGIIVVDEVGAVVMDIGHYSSKIGYAGEDSPRSEVSTIIAVHDAPTKVAEELDRFESSQSAPSSTSQSNRERKHYIDTTKVMVPRSGQEIKTFLRDGISKCLLHLCQTYDGT